MMDVSTGVLLLCAGRPSKTGVTPSLPPLTLSGRLHQAPVADGMSECVGVDRLCMRVSFLEGNGERMLLVVACGQLWRVRSSGTLFC